MTDIDQTIRHAKKALAKWDGRHLVTLRWWTLQTIIEALDAERRDLPPRPLPAQRGKPQ